MKTKDTTARLPGYDAVTARSERFIFAGLGLAALVMIGAAGIQSTRFAETEKEIAQRFDAPSVIVKAPTAVSTPTNIAARHPRDTKRPS